MTATIRLPDGRTGSARETIRVRDLLIVALGDSLATGEGNPEVPARWENVKSSGSGWMLAGRLDPREPARWADGGPDGDQPRESSAGVLPATKLLHARAHRSTRSAPAALAMRVEADDPHTSVSFVCLAATGARTDDLFVSDRSNHNKALGPGPALPAQLDELHAIQGARPADVVVLSIGFNDARITEFLGELVRREIRYVDPLRLLAAFPTRKDWALAKSPELTSLVDPAELPALQKLGADARRYALSQDAALIYDVAEGAEAALAATRQHLERLTRAIAQDALLARADVYLLEYPDATGDSNGATAPAILNDLVPGLRVNRRELDLARDHLLRPLNLMLRQTALRQGWNYVDGILASFQSHGYATADPWFVRAKESEQLEGPRLSPVGYVRGEITPGMLHPNRRGHLAIADRLFQSLEARSSSRISHGPDSIDQRLDTRWGADQRKPESSLRPGAMESVSGSH